MSDNTKLSPDNTTGEDAFSKALGRLKDLKAELDEINHRLSEELLAETSSALLALVERATSEYLSSTKDGDKKPVYDWAPVEGGGRLSFLHVKSRSAMEEEEYQKLLERSYWDRLMSLSGKAPRSVDEEEEYQRLRRLIEERL